jgi:hypothetical protein
LTTPAGDEALARSARMHHRRGPILALICALVAFLVLLVAGSYFLIRAIFDF